MEKDEKTLAEQLFGISKRRVNSHKKGKTNEQRLSNLLTKWVGVNFNRVPRSGGARNHSRTDYIGDIVCSDENYYFPFTIEAKTVNSFSIKSIMRPNCKVNRYWTQAKVDAKRAKKFPILFCRKNGMKKDEHYVCLSTNCIDIKSLSERCSIQFQFGETLDAEAPMIYSFLFSEIRNKFTYEEFYNLLNK